MSLSTAIAINGRYAAAKPTGVQRVARSLIKALDGALNADETSTVSAELLLPSGVDPKLKLKSIKAREVGFMTGQAWEQLEFPRTAGTRSLVNLCNAAPLWRESAATMIHDAQVFISPKSYSPQFVAWYRFSLPKIADRAHRVLTVSEFSKAMLVEYEICKADKIDVVYNGVDHVLDIDATPNALANLGLRPLAFVVVFGNLQDHKNLRVILQAFQAPALSQLKLLIIGDVNAQAIEEHLQCATPPNAIFVGRAPDEDMRAFLEGALCMVYPSKTEGFGLPPLEAMTFGCPAIVAPNGALPEVCGDAVLYADTDSAEAWVGAISQLVMDPDLRSAMVDRGRRQAAKFTWSRSGERLLGIIREVTG